VDKEYLKCKLLVKEVLDRLTEDFNDEDFESALESLRILELYVFTLNKFKQIKFLDFSICSKYHSRRGT